MNAYGTLSALKARLGVPDQGDDAVLEALGNAVAREIDDFCQRRFYAAAQTRAYTATCSDRLLLGDDLLSVTALKTDEDGDRTYEVTWAAAEYDLLPANNALDGLPFWELRARWASASSSGRWFPAGVPLGVQVQGSFGYCATGAHPAPVGEAWMFQVVTAYRARQSPSGITGSLEFDGDVRGLPAHGVGLHPFTRRLLEPYRKVPVA